MTNREKYFLKRDEYDTMIEIAKNIKGVGTYCAIRAVSGTKRPCLTQYTDEGHIYRDCETCIQDWLNQEADQPKPMQWQGSLMKNFLRKE